MFRIINDFKTYPPSVQKGLVLLLVGWIWFFMAMEIFFKIDVPTRMLVSGAGVVVLAGSMKNWARWLCNMCNAMACLYCLGYAFLYVFHSNQGGLSLLSTSLILSAILFALATFFLSIKSSSEFYKAYNLIEESP